MADQIVYVVHFEATPGCEKELFAALTVVRSGSRSEPGCILYELSRDAENPARFLLYETFADSAAYEAHRAAPHFLEFQKFLGRDPRPTTGIQVTSWRPVA